MRAFVMLAAIVAAAPAYASDPGYCEAQAIEARSHLRKAEEGKSNRDTLRFNLLMVEYYMLRMPSQICNPRFDIELKHAELKRLLPGQ